MKTAVLLGASPHYGLSGGMRGFPGLQFSKRGRYSSKRYSRIGMTGCRTSSKKSNRAGEMFR